MLLLKIVNKETINCKSLLKFKPINYLCNSSRSITKQRGTFLKYFSRKSRRSNHPPYSHIVQIGDPILRQETAPIPHDEISSDFVQDVISKMIKVLKNYECVGISCSQIGLPLKIVCFHFPKSYLRSFSEETIANREMEVFPLKVFINPTLKVLNYDRVVQKEGCQSMLGFSGDVERYREILISGLDEKGNNVSWQCKGWSARIVQHEMDHLNGKLFCDELQKNSLQFNYWEIVNKRSGEFTLNYSDFSSLRFWFFPKFLFGKE